MNGKETILTKIDISFIVYFYLDKYSFSLDTFWKAHCISKYIFIGADTTLW